MLIGAQWGVLIAILAALLGDPDLPGMVHSRTLWEFGPLIIQDPKLWTPHLGRERVGRLVQFTDMGP